MFDQLNPFALAKKNGRIKRFRDAMRAHGLCVENVEILWELQPPPKSSCCCGATPAAAVLFDRTTDRKAFACTFCAKRFKDRVRCKKCSKFGAASICWSCSEFARIVSERRELSRLRKEKRTKKKKCEELELLDPRKNYEKFVKACEKSFNEYYGFTP